MKRVVLVTGHVLQSKRRAGLHWLADAYWRAGWDVTFFTAAISWLSRLKGDYRFAYPIRKHANQLQQAEDRMTSYVWYTRWHPANLRSSLLNRLASGPFARYGELPLGPVRQRIEQADLIVFESTPGLLLLDRFKRLNPGARVAYRVSDDLRLLRNHPVVLSAEDECTRRADMVSVPSQALLARFSDVPGAACHPHGVCKRLFDQERPSPYEDQRTNAVFMGNARFDHDFIDRASRLMPDWAFHIVGDIPHVPRRPNVISYGEMPFDRTVPFVKHADIGLHTLEYCPGAESFSDSLKVMQYFYCKLPIVAPAFLRSDRTNTFCYQPGDDASIREALLAALAFDRSGIDVSAISSWDDLAAILAGD